MGRPGFGRVSMMNAIHQRDCENSDLRTRSYAWEDVARMLARAVTEKGYARRRRIAQAILEFPPYSRTGPESIVKKFGQKPDPATVDSLGRAEAEASKDEMTPCRKRQ